MSEFDRCMPHILAHEGGYVNDPLDPGGETNFGITRRVYDDWRRSKGQPVQSVKSISQAEVFAIYRAKYWDLFKGDELPAGVSYAVFDGAVNSGVAQSVKWLQRALGINADGIVGPTTIKAANDYPDPARLCSLICDRRLLFLKALKTYSRFGKGWARRVNDVRATSMSWSASPAPAAFVDGAQAKALLSDAKPAPVLAVADASTGSGIGSGGLAATLQQVQDQLSPLSYSSELIGKVVAGLVIVGGALTIGGLAYRYYAQRKKARLNDALDIPVAA